MTPQFVDLDADGLDDLLAATYDGSPHLALGTEAGFLTPEHLTDSGGQRVILSQYWDYEEEEWVHSEARPEGHITSALAFDEDGDGDLDLLFGDYRSGRLFLRENTGGPDDPVFDGPNRPLEVDGRVFELPGGVSSMQLVDWDGDGREDLLLGGYRGSKKAGAGIAWCRNTGESGVTSFSYRGMLVEPRPFDDPAPRRPGKGLHLQATDWNGDGRLDLLVGGYTHWTPPLRRLTPTDVRLLLELDGELVAAEAALGESMERALGNPGDLTDDELEAASDAYFASDEWESLKGEEVRVRAAIQALSPGPQSEGSVWVYLREAGGSVSTAGAR